MRNIKNSNSSILIKIRYLKFTNNTLNESNDHSKPKKLINLFIIRKGSDSRVKSDIKEELNDVNFDNFLKNLKILQ